MGCSKSQSYLKVAVVLTLAQTFPSRAQHWSQSYLKVAVVLTCLANVNVNGVSVAILPKSGCCSDQTAGWLVNSYPGRNPT